MTGHDDGTTDRAWQENAQMNDHDTDRTAHDKGTRRW
jgi:hypothetical protein